MHARRPLCFLSVVVEGEAHWIGDLSGVFCAVLGVLSHIFLWLQCRCGRTLLTAQAPFRLSHPRTPWQLLNIPTMSHILIYTLNICIYQFFSFFFAKFWLAFSYLIYYTYEDLKKNWHLYILINELWWFSNKIVLCQLFIYRENVSFDMERIL